MLDRHADPRWRQLATQQAQNQLTDHPARLNALRRIAWHNDYPAQQRCDAFKQLAQINENQLIQDASQRITRIKNTAVLNCLFDLAIARRWPGATALAVSGYAQHDPADKNPPHRRVIQTLNPGKTVDQVAYEVFTATHPDNPSHAQQAAAWQLLNRITTPTASRNSLTHAQPTTTLIADLQAAAADLNAVPTNREGVLWLAWLRATAQRPFWQRAAAAVAKLTTQQQAHLELRHLPTLLHQTRDALTADKNHLLNTLTDRVQLTDRFNTPHKDGQLPTPSQNLEHWANKLAWPDLITIDLLTNALQDPAVAQSLFQQADADLADPHTEHGGVLDKTLNRFTATPYEPLMRRHDRVFYPSQKMIEHLYTALAHYHFHAQQHNNRQYAGPGRGDLAAAERMNFNCLVFTFTDPNTLNADYYQPNGVVIDLGSIKRPK